MLPLDQLAGLKLNLCVKNKNDSNKLKRYNFTELVIVFLPNVILFIQQIVWA